ncbi:multidrug transporter [Rhizina undulata]
MQKPADQRNNPTVPVPVSEPPSSTPPDSTSTPANSNHPLRDQSERLPPKQFILVCISLVLGVFITSLEQSSVSTTLPAISKDFGTGNGIGWVGSSFFIANTAGLAVWEIE